MPLSRLIIERRCELHGPGYRDEPAGTFLYAADGGPNRRIHMFDGAFHLVKSFDDPAIPKNLTPYGIQTVKWDIWAASTALNKAQGGFVDVFEKNVIWWKAPPSTVLCIPRGALR